MTDYIKLYEAMPSVHRGVTEESHAKLTELLKYEISDDDLKVPESVIEMLDYLCERTHPEVVERVMQAYSRYDWTPQYAQAQHRLGITFAQTYPHFKAPVLGQKVLGLDIDGVLNSFRSAVISSWSGGKLFEVVNDIWQERAEVQKFDQVGLVFLQRLCKLADVGVLLVTQQRVGIGPVGMNILSEEMGLPIVGMTRSFGARKDEIMEWLNQHPGVQRFASVDDEYYYVDIHKASAREPSELTTDSIHVRVDQHNGILYHDMCRLSEFFGIDVHDTFKKDPS